VLALLYPSKSSIDAWAKLGNKGWDWEGLQPYYRKFSKINPPSEKTAKTLSTSYIDESVRGSSGPLQASFPEFYGPLGQAWIETFKNLNLSNNADPLSGKSVGGITFPSSVDPKKWERSHAGNAYYAPVADRSNLHLITECMVEKLEIQKLSCGDLVATGVSFTRNGKHETKKARREVLLCAGVFQSPQLLELSGIGDAKLLKSQGIDVLLDNPNVGENLQDHAMTGMCFEVNDGLPTIDMIRDPQVIQGAMTAYMTSREGPLTSSFHSGASIPVVEFLTEPGRSELLRLLETHLAKGEPQQGGIAAPSLAKQYAAIRSMLENPDEASATMAMGASQIHFDKDTHKEVFAISDPKNYMCVLLALSCPMSRGSVHIASASLSDPPTIDPRYLSHPLDLEILARHMRFIPAIAGTKPLADFLKPNGSRLPTGADVSTLDAAKEHVKRNIITFNHPCGTCAMMPRDMGGVVDDRLKVHGVKGLRVLDASIFPMIPKGNIQSSVYAVAEKAADLIKEDWQGAGRG
jgi:choline dehydrogenase-like flavoprotein